MDGFTYLEVGTVVVVVAEQGDSLLCDLASDGGAWVGEATTVAHELEKP